MSRAEKPVSIWEILELVEQASESVRPFAVQFAQRVASIETKGKIETNIKGGVEDSGSTTSQIGALEFTKT